MVFNVEPGLKEREEALVDSSLVYEGVESVAHLLIQFSATKESTPIQFCPSPPFLFLVGGELQGHYRPIEIQDRTDQRRGGEEKN